MELFDWQRPLAEAAVKALEKDRIFILGACTGSGKTPITCEVIKRLGCPALIVAPKVSLTQWKKTIEAMNVCTVVGIINPEQISKPGGCSWCTHEGKADDRKSGDLCQWHIPKDCLVVFDEIHRGASGPNSVTTQAVATLRAYQGSRLMALSATVADSPLKLRALGYWLGFHNYSIRDFHRWCKNYGCSSRVIGWGRRSRSIFTFTTSPTRARLLMGEIRKTMGDRFLSVKPEDIPGFPDEELDVLRLDLAAKDRDALERAYEEMPDQYKDLTEDEMVQTLRLREQAEWCKAEAIAEMAVSFESDGLSVFILVNFTDARKRIEDYLKDKGVAYASIYGGQKDAERQEGIDAFQRNDIHVLVAMAAAASCALSAHDERHERPRVSLISPGYNASDVKQGLGRIRRVNGTKAVQHFVLAAESVEERVAKTLERKLANIDSLNDGDLLR